MTFLIQVGLEFVDGQLVATTDIAGRVSRHQRPDHAHRSTIPTRALVRAASVRAHHGRISLCRAFGGQLLVHWTVRTCAHGWWRVQDSVKATTRRSIIIDYGAPNTSIRSSNIACTPHAR
jgi:hypothetical protein